MDPYALLDRIVHQVQQRLFLALQVPMVMSADNRRCSMHASPVKPEKSANKDRPLSQIQVLIVQLATIALQELDFLMNFHVLQEPTILTLAVLRSMTVNRAQQGHSVTLVHQQSIRLTLAQLVIIVLQEQLTEKHFHAQWEHTIQAQDKTRNRIAFHAHQVTFVDKDLRERQHAHVEPSPMPLEELLLSIASHVRKGGHVPMLR
mmetsp:Transcript_6171/g.23311  ORF Transcript_6171/g.23311 Transcript_6171/m.23311 type:complete len:204 (-) Transcript_6171:11582-12193(-)